MSSGHPLHMHAHAHTQRTTDVHNTSVPALGIRRSTILVFFDLMVSQLQQQGNLLNLETEMIDKLDTLISEGMGDAGYRQMFYRM